MFDLVISEIRDGRLNSFLRVSDMLKYLQNYGATKKHEIHSTQNFVEQLIALYAQDEELRKNLYRHRIVDLCETLKSDFRGDKPFKVFGPIIKDLDLLDEFMTTRNPTRAIEIADDFDNNNSRVFYIRDMKEIFGKPAGFKMPPRANAKGQTMPTDWLFSKFHGTDAGYRIEQTIEAIGLDCDYEVLTDLEMQRGRFARYGGKIIAVGNREINAARGKYNAQESYRVAHSRYENFMFAINTLYDFDQGKISARDVVERVAKYCATPNRDIDYEYTKNIIIKWLGRAIILQDYRGENGSLESEIRGLNDSVAFVEMYIKPFLQILKQSLKTTNPKLADDIHIDKPPQGKTWIEYLQYVSEKYLKLKEAAQFYIKSKLYGGTLYSELKAAGRRVGIQDKNSPDWNVAAGPIVVHISGVQTKKLHSVLGKFVDAAVADGVYSSYDAAEQLFSQLLNFGDVPTWPMLRSKLANDVREREAAQNIKLTADTIEHYSVYASRQQWAGHNYTTITDALDREVEQHNNLHKIRHLLQAYGMIANNEQELVAALGKPVPRLSDRKTYTLEKRLKEYCLTYYMRNNPPIKDLYSVLAPLSQNDLVSKFRPAFTDEFWDYIETNNLMPQKFDDLYRAYAIMERVRLFSHAKPAQSLTMDALITMVEKMPRATREMYAWKLLSGFYYADDDARCAFNRDDNHMDMPLAKNKLVEIYVGAVAERLGRDDNSAEYLAKIKELVNFINQEHLYDPRHSWMSRVGLDKVTQGSLYRGLTDRIQSQERVSQLLANDKNITVSDNNAQSYDMWGRAFETFLDELSKHPTLSVYTIEFLNQKLTAKSIRDYCDKCMNSDEGGYVAHLLSASMVENCYHTFWSSDLKVRALIMGKLLNRAYDTLDEKIKYVCDMNFDKNDKYRADAEMICDCVIKSFEPYERNLILAAIASADENKQAGQKSARSVGDGLRMFFETMGPAWVKFGQLLSYVPDLPSEIRHDLGKLKDRADIPARWDVYTWLHKALPENLYKRIVRVEDVVGAGSFWMTMVVQFQDEHGVPEKKVIQLLRPYADNRADSGFETIERAIRKLAKRNSAYKVLHNVARQAHNSAKYEVDADFGSKQYQKAKELYGDISVDIDGTTYTPHVADWRHFGTGQDAFAYKIMDYADGATLSRVRASVDERRKMALAYFTIEMTVLFKGDVWDIDRHQGQQNFDITSPTTVDINIYDTGAQLPKAPDKTNKVLLANIFFGLMQTVQRGASIDSFLLKTIKQLDKLQNTLGVDVSYVSNVEKGLMALSDIIEYQKEIKDKDGNVIQERLALTGDDLKNAIMAVLQNPSVDKYLSVILRGRAVADKVLRLQLKELRDLAHTPENAPENPVRINIAPNNEKRAIVHKLNKAASEIKAQESENDTVLGIPTKYIRFKNGGNPPITLEPPAKEIA